jgi:hypothetical protein
LACSQALNFMLPSQLECQPRTGVQQSSYASTAPEPTVTFLGKIAPKYFICFL